MACNFKDIEIWHLMMHFASYMGGVYLLIIQKPLSYYEKYSGIDICVYIYYILAILSSPTWGGNWVHI